MPGGRLGPVHSDRCAFCGWAADYEIDHLSRLLGVYQHKALQLLDPDNGDFLLDVGCGTGRAVRMAARSVAASAGVDACPRMIGRARKLGAGLPRAEFLVSSADRLPFAEGTFTAVLCTSVLRHVSDRAAVVGEMARVLAPGGRVVVGDFLVQVPGAGRRARRLAAKAATASLACSELTVGPHMVCSTFLGPYLITRAVKSCPESRKGVRPFAYIRKGDA